jgi:RNA polymerase sigma factor (sigma-70 family)
MWTGHNRPVNTVRFETTQWSLVVAAGGDDSSASREALAALCRIYWYPLYAYVRRQGRSADDARDLTQAFFASLIERRDFDDLHEERGRFRAFLLASLRHFLANDDVRRQALKRGGGVALLPLPFDDAEGRYRHEPAEPATPETIFERRWALTVIDRVLADLRRDSVEAGRADEFDRLKACLLGDTPPGGYRALAAELATTEGAIKVAAHRLRRRFQAALRRHIAETVLDPAAIDDEIRYLIRALDR